MCEVCNFKGGDILEPACGSGAFFEYMPKEIAGNSKVTGIEMDMLTCKLVQAIYPKVKMINNKIQDVDFSGLKYDLIIGNPPYSGEMVTDNVMPDLNGYTIHHYFTAKCMRLLKDNGILAFVLPAFYMDIPRKNTRAIINNEAVLIDAVRLPENIFEQATVTVDIVFIRKTGNKIHEFVNTVELEQDGKKDSINQYWIDKPQRILGELKLKWVEPYQRHVPTCITPDVQKTLNDLSNCHFDKATKDNFLAIASSPCLKPLLVEKLTLIKAQLSNLPNCNLINLDDKINQIISKVNEIIDII